MSTSWGLTDISVWNFLCIFSPLIENSHDDEYLAYEDDDSSKDYPESGNFTKEEKGKDNPVDRFKKMYEACGLGLYVLHPFDKESMGACCAEHAENTKEKYVFRIQRRLDHKKERKEKQGCEEILVKSDEHTRELKCQFSVQNSEHGKSQASQESPEDTHKGRIIQVETRDDQENAHETEQREQEVDFDDSFSEEKRFEKGCEHGVRRKGEEADSDSRHLDGLKESRPMDREDESKEQEIAGIFSLGNFHALSGKPENKNEREAGKKYSPQDNDKRRESNPFPEQPG